MDREPVMIAEVRELRRAYGSCLCAGVYMDYVRRNDMAAIIDALNPATCFALMSTTTTASTSPKLECLR